MLGRFLGILLLFACGVTAAASGISDCTTLEDLEKILKRVSASKYDPAFVQLVLSAPDRLSQRDFDFLVLTVTPSALPDQPEFGAQLRNNILKRYNLIYNEVHLGMNAPESEPVFKFSVFVSDLGKRALIRRVAKVMTLVEEVEQQFQLSFRFELSGHPRLANGKAIPLADIPFMQTVPSKNSTLPKKSVFPDFTVQLIREQLDLLLASKINPEFPKQLLLAMEKIGPSDAIVLRLNATDNNPNAYLNGFYDMLVGRAVAVDSRSTFSREGKATLVISPEQLLFVLAELKRTETLSVAYFHIDVSVRQGNQQAAPDLAPPQELDQKEQPVKVVTQPLPEKVKAKPQSLRAQQMQRIAKTLAQGDQPLKDNLLILARQLALELFSGKTNPAAEILTEALGREQGEKIFAALDASLDRSSYIDQMFNRTMQDFGSEGLEKLLQVLATRL